MVGALWSQRALSAFFLMLIEIHSGPSRSGIWGFLDAMVWALGTYRKPARLLCLAAVSCYAVNILPRRKPGELDYRQGEQGQGVPRRDCRRRVWGPRRLGQCSEPGAGPDILGRMLTKEDLAMATGKHRHPLDPLSGSGSHVLRL